MLFRDNDEHHGGTLRRVRDIVEIVAIVAAGIWAFYIFIYENRIVPSQAAPTASFSATLEKVSEHNGLIAVRLVTKIRNPGTVRDNFLGYIITVAGQRVEIARRPNQLREDHYNISLDEAVNISKLEPVFSRGNITSQGDPKSRSGLRVEPGEEDAHEYILYVPSGKYDRLVAEINARYTREDRVIATGLTADKTGMPLFTPRDHGNELTQFLTAVASLDLHGK